MKTILVTGAIGSGKSEVCRVLSSRGYPVYDCDSRCKGLYDSVPGLKQQIEEELGIPFGDIALVFERPDLLGKLEALVFPLLKSDILSWRSCLGSELCFIESATALSKEEFRGIWDEVWLVKADFKLRSSRNPKAVIRDSLQSFDESLADRIIINEGTLDELNKKIDIIL